MSTRGIIKFKQNKISIYYYRESDSYVEYMTKEIKRMNKYKYRDIIDFVNEFISKSEIDHELITNIDNFDILNFDYYHIIDLNDKTCKMMKNLTWQYGEVKPLKEISKKLVKQIGVK